MLPASGLTGPEAVTVPDPALRVALEKAAGTSPLTAGALARLSGALDLAFRDIRSVEGLQYATGVTAVLLTGNGVDDASPLAGLGGLKRLDLDYNPLESLPADLSGLASLTELHVGHTRLRRIPESLAGLPALRRLYAEGLEVSEAPGDLSGLSDTLDRLFVSGTPLPDWSFLTVFPRLELLDMRGCALRELPASVRPLTGLMFLYLRDNALETLPGWIGELARLERLDLAGNRLCALPSGMASLTNLRHLVLSGNELFELPGWITGFSRLEALLVSDNHLSRVPDGFEKLRRLYRFSFRNNNLSSIGSVGRIRVGYPYQVSFGYNLLDPGDPATAALLRYYNQAGAAQKTPISARILAAGRTGVTVGASFDAAHDAFLKDASIGSPRLYRRDGQGLYRFVAEGAYDAAEKLAYATDPSGPGAGIPLRYQLVIPAALPGGEKVYYQAGAAADARLSPSPGPATGGPSVSGPPSGVSGGAGTAGWAILAAAVPLILLFAARGAAGRGKRSG